MNAMKNMNMNRMLDSLKRKPRDSNSEDASPESQLDTPEANAARNVRLFCESGGPNGSGEEVLFLPTIVESAESSPSAAKECANVIRKFLSKDNYGKPYVQYNAIMLVRILADNPGKTFTRNLDAKFVQTVKELLRAGRDPSVKQILMETLDTFQREKANDEGLLQLTEMWKKEHERIFKGSAGPRTLNAPPFDPHSQNYFSRNHHSRRLPSPAELSSRIEEARTSAKLLSQVVQSTPPSELLQNELVREFVDRCQSASRSVQAYMIAENPSPDNDTMETLIDTNELLSKAMSQHQRAVLQARKAAGLGSAEGRATPPARTQSGFAPPPGPPPKLKNPPVPVRKGVPASPQVPSPQENKPTGITDDDEEHNPFKDPVPGSSSTTTNNPPYPEDKPPTAIGQFNDRLGIEPYHPGFKETQSYIGRQDSSLGGVTMHAAVPESVREGEETDATPAGGKEPIYRY